MHDVAAGRTVRCKQLIACSTQQHCASEKVAVAVQAPHSLPHVPYSFCVYAQLLLIKIRVKTCALAADCAKTIQFDVLKEHKGKRGFLMKTIQGGAFLG